MSALSNPIFQDENAAREWLEARVVNTETMALSISGAHQWLGAPLF